MVEPLAERSKEELYYIANWYSSKFDRTVRPIRLLLVGGWAVWSYNNHEPSVDIDIIASNKTRNSLFFELKTERGYIEERTHTREKRILFLPHENGRIEIDYGRPRDRPLFKGRKEELPWNLGMSNFQMVDIEDGFIPVPERGILLLFKLKAISDRSWSLEAGEGDPSWLRTKLAKDRSDALALLDPARGGEDINLGLLGRELGRLPFLTDLLRSVANDQDACRRYRCSRDDAIIWVDRLLSLTVG
jgi:hypothetical protein